MSAKGSAGVLKTSVLGSLDTWVFQQIEVGVGGPASNGGKCFEKPGEGRTELGNNHVQFFFSSFPGSCCRPGLTLVFLGWKSGWVSDGS